MGLGLHPPDLLDIAHRKFVHGPVGAATVGDARRLQPEHRMISVEILQ